MANPVKQLQRKSEEYQRLDKADRRRFWSDGILNNALYILMVIFIVYTAIKNKNFLSAGSIANIVSLVAASLPMALGIAGCIVLTGTDLSGGRVVGLTAAVAGALMPMLPGLAMTNAVQDTMRGDMVSGISSAVSAAMSAVLLAVGALAGTAFLRLLTGGAA